MNVTEERCARPPDEPVAYVGQEVLTRAHLDRRLARIRARVGVSALPVPGSPEDVRLERWTVQTLVDEALLRRAARQLDPAVDVELGQPLPDEVTVAVFEAITGDPPIETAARDHYERHLARYHEPGRRRVLQVVRADPARAQELATAAGQVGLPVAAAASDVEVEALTVVAGRVGGELERQVLAADLGAIVGPVTSPLGLHVVQLEHIEPARTRPYEEVARAIRAELSAAERGRRFDRWLLGRRDEHVTLCPGYEHPGDPRIPDAVHRH